MTSFNPAVLKQLLDQFIGQEQLILNDLEAVNKQIQELEAQIERTKSRQTSIDADCQKIMAMKERYSGIQSESGSQFDVTNISEFKPSKAEPAKRNKQTSGTAENVADKLNILSEVNIEEEKEPEPVPAQQQATLGSWDLEEEEQQPDASAGETGESQDLKSINEALRQLFR